MERDIALCRSIAAAIREHMLGEYIPRIRHCVSLLTDEQVWHKPSPYGNSVGNLLLHLAGNVRQWIQVGLGGAADHRDRPGEFSAEQVACPGSPTELVDELETAVQEAITVIEGLSPDALLTTVGFQGGRYQADGVHGVLHVLEHFSGHAGQIYAYTKTTLGIDLEFYDL